MEGSAAHFRGWSLGGRSYASSADSWCLHLRRDAGASVTACAPPNARDRMFEAAIKEALRKLAK